MKPAYRIPKGKFPLVDRFVSQETEANTPITEMVVNSLITNLEERAEVCCRARRSTSRGVAWDGGYGIARVEVSEDGGRTWRAAQLGADLGRFCLAPVVASLHARHAPGSHTLHGQGDQPRRRDARPSS